MDREHDADGIRSHAAAAIPASAMPSVAMPKPLGPARLALSMLGIAGAAVLIVSLAAAAVMLVLVVELGHDGTSDLIEELKFSAPLRERLSAGIVSALYTGLAGATLAAAMLRGGRGWRDLVALRPVRATWPVWRDVLGIVAVTLAYVGLSTYAVEHARDHGLLISGPTDMLLIGTLIANLVILAPIAEELLFRGWLYTALRHRFSFWPSFLTTLATFAAIHWDSRHPRVVQVLPLAAALGLLRERAGSIKPTIALHAVYNLVIIVIRLAYT